MFFYALTSAVARSGVVLKPIVRIQEFLSGGVQARRPEIRLDNFFVFLFSPHVILQFTEEFLTPP